jgi:hypothetical protein
MHSDMLRGYPEACNKSLRSSDNVVRSFKNVSQQNYDSPAKPASLYSPKVTLPAEILLLIVTISAMHKIAAPLEPLDLTSEFPRAAVKPNFEMLRGLSGACHWLHVSVRKLWFRTLYVREHTDWEIALEFGVCEYVK